MYPDIETIKQILLKESYISEEDSKTAEAGAATSADYIAHLMQQEILTKTLLGQALAEQFKVPFADLAQRPIAKEALDLIPEDIARDQRVVVFKQDDKNISIASDAPKNIDAKKITPLFKGKKVFVTYTLPEYIDEAFGHYEQPFETRFSKIIESGRSIAPEIVDEILKDALMLHASDIHFEPQTAEVIVRFRVDGNLREAGRIPKEYYVNILNRIKVESGMRIDEHLTAQDGAIQRRTDEYSVDLRVSLVPTVEGEKTVMRVLGSYIQSYTLADIGLSDDHKELLATYAARPFGMILTVGPTGSGKTTTLYSLVKLLNRPNVNITSIEDPVEYKIGGVNQIQVREQTGMTFARGLRSIVRQDPDVILVGEIRDKDTAEIAVNAALTGHLLLSTFHANDAATAIPRLVDMGIESFLLASTLEVVIAQRLVRKICRTCRYTVGTDEVLKKIPAKYSIVRTYFNSADTLYAGKGCNICAGTGYNGRTALYEFIEVTPEMQDLIVKDPATQEIERLARQQGSKSMFEDGVEKIKGGMTTIDEVMRVVSLPTTKGSQSSGSAGKAAA